MTEIDVSLARQRQGADHAELPEELRSQLSPEATEMVLAFAFEQSEAVERAARMENVSPLDSRYPDSETQSFLSEQTRIGYQACVESALAQTLAEFGHCSQVVADEISEACKTITAQEVYDEEYGVRTPDGTVIKPATRHDIKALTNCISAKVSDEAKPIVHLTATSFDIISTAEALRYREATKNLVLPRLGKLEATLIDLAERYAGTPQIGRSHGQHGEPVTFGFAIAQTVNRLGNSMLCIDGHALDLKGKFSGAMGAYNASSQLLKGRDPEEFEAAVLAKLGLKPELISTQIASPDNTVRLMDELAIAAGIMSNLANDMRQLQRTEIAEVGEPFDAKNQTGSSAMPHKRNPISFENINSLNRVVQALARVGHDNLESEHQRDLRDSASSRFYPELFAAVAEMAKKLQGVMTKLEVDEPHLQANLKMGGGKVASGLLQTALREAGHTAAHDAVREVMALADERHISFQDALRNRPDLMEYLVGFDIETRQMIMYPENTYLGIAEKKALKTAESWRNWLTACNLLPS